MILPGAALEWGLQWGLVMVDTAALRADAASIVEGAVSPTTYQFHHDLVREAVYATLSAVRRQRLHRRAAQTTLRQFAQQIDIWTCWSSLWPIR